MSGRKIVVALVVLASAGAIGATWYRQAARPTVARDLSIPERRARAFLKLLRLNNLRGLAQDHFHDARKASQGSSYILARGPDGNRWHVVRAVNVAETNRSTTATVVFAEDGTITAIIEGGIPALLGGTPDDGLAAIVAPSPNSVGSHSVFFVGKDLTEGLRVQGAFLLEPLEGRTVRIPDSADDADLPVFRFDLQAGKLRGPQGGPDKPWRVDLGHSPRYLP